MQSSYEVERCCSCSGIEVSAASDDGTFEGSTTSEHALFPIFNGLYNGKTHFHLVRAISFSKSGFCACDHPSNKFEVRRSAVFESR